MRRKALLFGNTAGLPGVNVDLDRFSAFLKSPVGGAWFGSEIDILTNMSKSDLLQYIQKLQANPVDYFILLFSGHGGQARETILEINGKGETIAETSLRKLGTRQLNIYDCCRVHLQELTESTKFLRSEAMNVANLNARRKYESRIQQAIPQ